MVMGRAFSRMVLCGEDVSYKIAVCEEVFAELKDGCEVFARRWL
jgi:hypothetical protein